MLLNADGKPIKRAIGFGAPLYVRVGVSTPAEDLCLIGESMPLKEDETCVETRKKENKCRTPI